MIFSQIIASVVGVSIRKLSSLAPDMESTRWLAGAASCATTTALMALTNSIHPPAGATALLAVVDDKVANLDWYLIPVVMLGCLLMLITALLINNIQRRFPIYWWTEEFLRHSQSEDQGMGSLERDIESAKSVVDISHREDRAMVASGT
jgi:CBS-domain-containing membrane protein